MPHQKFPPTVYFLLENNWLLNQYIFEKAIENENVAYGCDPKGGEGKSNRNTTFILTGFIDSDFPQNFKPPPFSFNDTSTGSNNLLKVFCQHLPFYQRI